MFLKFTKQSTLVREDLVVSTELITTIQKGSSKLPTTNLATTPTTFNPSTTITTSSTTNGETASPQTFGIELGDLSANVIDKEIAYYIFIFMRDPILNKSQNNRTFNNAVILEFRETIFGGESEAMDARDQYWNLLTGVDGINATTIEIENLPPPPQNP